MNVLIMLRRIVGSGSGPEGTGSIDNRVDIR